MKRKSIFVFLSVLALALIVAATVSVASPSIQSGPPPTMVSYQGYVKVGGTPYEGTGYFKFAIVDSASGDGTTNYWANDGTASGEPSAELALTVSEGLFDVLLGDTDLPGMTEPLDGSAFDHDKTYLRVWFSQTSGGTFQALEPNQRLASVPYALRAQYAESAGPRVSFSAKLSQHQQLDTNFSTILFDTEDHDFGDNYDPSTGRFTAPTDGVYHFDVHLFTYSNLENQWCYVHLNKNGGHILVSQVQNRGSTDWDLKHSVVSLASTEHLVAGDLIYVQTRCSSTSVTAYFHDTQFSGFQVFETP